MRVLHVSSATAWGGGEQHLADLTAGLAGRGHEVELAIRPSSPLREACAAATSAIHTLPLRNSLDLLSARALREILRTRKIDILHAHLARDYAVCALAVRNVEPTRLILTRHHYLPMSRNAVYRRVLGRTSRIIAVSAYVREQLLLSGWDESRIVVIHNWLSPRTSGQFGRPIPRTQALRESGLTLPLIVGSAGELTPPKGHEDFVRAAKMVMNGYPEAEFAIAGDDPAADRPTGTRLTGLIREFGLQDRFRLLPAVRPLTGFLQLLDVFVLPSWNEAFSLVLIEAMAEGLAVIATDAGGPAEIVRHEETGLLVPPRNPAALAAALTRLLGDDNLRRRLGAAAKTDVTARFDFNRALDQVEDVYRSVMADLL